MSLLPQGRRLGILVALAVTFALAACQPVDEIDDLDTTEAGENGDGANPLGAPPSGAPGSLAEALSRAEVEAAQWQRGARLAEAVVQVGGAGDLVESRLTYLAADADRLLSVHVTRDGLRQERPVLDVLDLPPLPAGAVEAIPPLPEGLREPVDLAAAAGEAFAECGVDGEPSTVIYATGAPLAWDPATGAWTAPPAWTATVLTDTGAGAVLDPVSAATTDCLPPGD